jgi:GT2 family glycosyltransferase
MTPPQSPPLVYAVVLHWRTPELTSRCVRALARQTPVDGAFRLRIVVVDNGSGDLPGLPDVNVPVEVLRLPDNLGYAGGNNAGLRLALSRGADHVFLVNSDVIPAPTCLDQLLVAAQAHPKAGLLGPLVLRERTPWQVESNGQSFNRWTGRHREWDRNARAWALPTRSHAVDAVSGCALLVSRAAVEAAGGLDERFFLYFEDMDWCLRARAAGFETVAVPVARVWHRGSASIGTDSPRTTFYSVRNHAWVARRHAPRIVRPAIGALVMLYHLAFLLTNPRRRSVHHLAALLRAAWAARRDPESATNHAHWD